MITSRDKILERRVISDMILRKEMHPDVRKEWFCGEERVLVDEIEEQYIEHKTIDIHIMNENLQALAIECLELDSTNTEGARSELKGHWIKRTIGESIALINPSEDATEIAKKLYENIGQTLTSIKEHKYDHKDEVRKLLDHIEKMSINDKGINGYSIGLKMFDEIISGFEREKMYVIGATKKTGKSRFMVYCACKCVQQGAGVLINSLEMSPMQLNMCALAYYSGIDSRMFGRKLEIEKYQKLNKGLSELYEKAWSVHFERTVSDLRIRIAHEKNKRNIDVVFVDFIQRMRNDKYGRDRVREVESIAQDLADLSREMNVAVIALSQLSGRAEELAEEEVPDMKYLKESQGIPENADTIITGRTMNKNASGYDNSGNYTFPEISFRIEQRYGVSGKIVKTRADLRTCRFSEIHGKDDFVF